MPPLSESQIPVECHGVLLTEIKSRCKAKGPKAVSFDWTRASASSTVDPRQLLPPTWTHEPYFINLGEKTYLGLRPLDRPFEALLSGYEERYKEPGSNLSAIRYTYSGGPPMTKAEVSNFVCEDVRRASSGQGISSRLRFCPIPIARVQEVEFEFTQTPVDLDQPSWATQALDGALYGLFPGPALVQTMQDHVLDNHSNLPAERATNLDVSFPKTEAAADAVVEMWSHQNLAWEKMTSCCHADLTDPAVHTNGWNLKTCAVQHQDRLKIFAAPQLTPALWSGIIGKHLPKNFDGKHAELRSSRFEPAGTVKDLSSACRSIQKNLLPTTSEFQEGLDDLRVFTLQSRHFINEEELSFRLRLVPKSPFS